MATIVRYVNTASSGGDGTTNGTSGGTAAYASLSAAEAALRQDLTGVTCDVADEQGNNQIALDILCTGSSADTTVVTFSNAAWVTDATHRVRVRLNGTGAGAKWDSSLYRLVAANSYNAGVINVSMVIHLDLMDLQVESTATLTNRPVAVRLNAFAWAVRVVRGFYRTTSTSGTFDNHAAPFRNAVSNSAANLRMQNVTLVAADGQAYFPGSNDSTTAVEYLYNCTMVNRSATARAVFTSSIAGGSDMRYKNLLIQGTGTTNYGISYGTPDEAVTILTQDTTSPTVGLRSLTATFVDATNWDYHLDTGSEGIDDGTDLSGDTYYPFSNDGDSVTRSGTWDVGADELASATLEQEGFRWYEDNGSESGSSASAAQDTNITAAAGATKRLRMLVNATGDPATKQYKLQWRKTAGTWADVL